MIFIAHPFWIFLIGYLVLMNFTIYCLNIFLMINLKPLFFFLLHWIMPCCVLYSKFYIDCYCSDAQKLLAVWNRMCSVQNIKLWLIFVTCISEHKSFHFSECSGTLQSKINRLLGPSVPDLKANAVSLLKSGGLQWVTRINSTWNLLNSH